MTDTILAINASLIKKFFFKGDALDICPKKIYAIDILKTDHIQTINMLRFSSFCFFVNFFLGRSSVILPSYPFPIQPHSK